MPKMKKQLGAKKEQFEVILEDINSKFDFIAEHVASHSTHLDKIDKKLTKIESDVEVIKMDIEFIKHELKQKINRDEFAALEKRLALLENKVGATL